MKEGLKEVAIKGGLDEVVDSGLSSYKSILKLLSFVSKVHCQMMYTSSS